MSDATSSAATPAPASARQRPVQTSGCRAGQPFAFSQKVYAELYSKPLVTIKRWWAKGYPLDDPDLMGEHLSPRGRKPDADPDDDFASPSIIPTGDDDADPDEGHAPIDLDESFFEGTGVLAEIQRLQKAGRERAAAYFDAVTHRRPAQLLQNRFKEWLAIVEALRKLEKDAPDIRKANDLSIDRADFEAAVAHVFQSFRQAANNLPARAAAKVLGLTDRDEIVEILEREIEALLRQLTEIAVQAAQPHA